LSAAFRTFSIQWDRSTPREEIRWYVDGLLFHTVHADDVDATTWADVTAHGYFIC
jgi:beta-glucanase (GH16 family)